MSTFLLLYRSTKSQTDDALDKKDTSSDLTRWQMEICNSLIDGGSSTTDGAKITKDATEPLPKDHVTNYCIIEARDKKEAVELSRGSPTLYCGGSAEVYEIASDV